MIAEVLPNYLFCPATWATRVCRVGGWFLFANLACAVPVAVPPPADAPAIWTLDRTDLVGGLVPLKLGAPQVVDTDRGKAVGFNGKDEGLIVPGNPVRGWAQFTIEVLFRPDADGQAEQRFLHIQDDSGARALLEIRLTPEKRWCLDTFLASGGNRLPLIDRGKLYDAGRWHWAALVYDGKKMGQYVDGVKLLEGDVAFAPTGAGQISLGVRLNRVYWFKGCIREVRFHPKAVAPAALQRPRDTN